MRARSDLAAVLALGALGAGLVVLGARHAAPTRLELGPNDRDYIEGFREDWERDADVRFRWTSPSAQLRLPLRLSGEGARLRLRLRRHFIEPANVRLIVEGRTVAAFEAAARREAAYRIVDVALPRLDGRHPFVLGIEAPSASSRPLGIALDWLELDPGDASARLDPLRLAQAAAATALAFAALRLAGAGLPLALAHGFGLALALAAFAWRDLVSFERVLREGFATYAFAALAAMALVSLPATRRALGTPEARTRAVLVLLVLVGLALRLGLLLHQQYFYPDVRVHGLFAWHLAREGLGPFLLDFTTHQFRYSLGLQQEGGHWYAFPYPPAFYVAAWPFVAWLGHRPEVAVTLLPALVNALEVLVVFAIGRRLGLAPATSLAGAAAVPVLPLFVERLSLAYFPALLGHAVDALVVLALLAWMERLDRPRAVVALGALLCTALLVYTQSLLNFAILLPLFLAFQAWAERDRPARRRQLGLLAAGLLGGALAFGLFYGRYVPIFLDMQRGRPMAGEEVLLDLMERRARTAPERAPEAPDDPYAGPGVDPIRGLQKTAWRLWLFYGAFAPVVVGGVVWLQRRQDDATLRRFVVAWALTYVVLNLASGALPGPNLVRYNKDLEIVAPLACLALGLVATEIARKTTLGAVLFGAAFWLYGLARAWRLLLERFEP